MMAIGADTGTGDVTSYNKFGQGAFGLAVFRDGRVTARRGDDGEVREFPSPRAAYDWYRALHDASQDHAAWNICYHLEDHLN